MKPIYLFDLDGTVCDNSHREHLIHGSSRDGYYDAIPGDSPIAHTVRLIQALSVDNAVGYVTGRPERWRDVTSAWLSKHRVLTPYVWMRGEDDRSKNAQAKLEILSRVRSDGFEPLIVFEDQATSTAAWRGAGVPCFQVTDHDF